MSSVGKKFEEKILERDALVEALRAECSAGRRVVFTNGCFDIIHPGHVAYLEDAAGRGEILVVGVNKDRSVKQLKGAGRPVNSEQDRARLVAGLASVDYVTLFGEETPLELIRALQPDVLVKGGDWPVERIVGHELVLGRGGEVFSLPFREGYSTTGLIEKIRSLPDSEPDNEA